MINKNIPNQQKIETSTQIKAQIHNKPTKSTSNRVIWDCGSNLYDSFELNSFQKQLDTAIINSSRSMSMPRLPSEDRRAPLPQPRPPPSSKKNLVSPKTISRSFQKLLRAVFRGPNKSSNTAKSNYDSCSPDPWFIDPIEAQGDKLVRKDVDNNGGKYYVIYDDNKAHALSTIPEVPEVNFSPEVRKTMSERFTAASLGIYCA